MKNQDQNNLAISHKEPGQFEETRFEKIHNIIFKSSEIASKIVAREIARLILEKTIQKRKLHFRTCYGIFSYKSL